MAIPKKLSSLTIFFPCHNEEANVTRVAEAAMRIGGRVADDFEVIVVDDGSTDRTGAIADALMRQYPHRIRAVHNTPNRGYGGALQRGFAEATKDWVFYTDGDGQFDLEEIDRLLPLLRDHDIASAYRLDRKDSPMRKLNAACWGALVRFLFHLKIRDIDCAFKIYPKRFIDSIELHSEGALIDTEMLARAVRAGLTVGQVGVHHYPRLAGEQSGGDLRVILRAFRELFRLRKRILHPPHAQSDR